MGVLPGSQHFEGGRVCRNFDMGTRKIDKQFIYSHKLAQNQTTSWLMHNWSTLVHERATSNHKLTKLIAARTWGKPPPSPLHYTLCLAMGPTPKCHFVPGLPSGSPEIPKVGTFVTLGAHNFVCIPLIEMRFKTKL